MKRPSPGASASNRAVKGEWLVGVVLSLVLVASLWWSYFDREDRRAADRLGPVDIHQKSSEGAVNFG
jgi:low temperature requirement protein LtrA